MAPSLFQMILVDSSYLKKSYLSSDNEDNFQNKTSGRKGDGAVREEVLSVDVFECGVVE